MANYKTKSKSKAYLLTGILTFGIMVISTLTLYYTVGEGRKNTSSDAVEASEKRPDHVMSEASKDVLEALTEDEMLILLQDEKVQESISAERERVRLAKIAEKERIRQEQIRLAQEKERQRLAKIEKEKQAEQQRIAQAKAQKHKSVDKQKEVVVSNAKKRETNGKTLGTFEATNYVSTCNGCSGVTASGYSVKSTIYYNGMRIVAAPKNIPFYTKLRITFANGSHMDAIVLDRGGAIKSGKLDILVASRQEALNFGRQQVKVEIIS